MAEEKKKSWFRELFNTQKEGKGVEKAPRAPLNFINFFGYYGRNIYDLFRINLLYVFGNFPIFFALFAMTGNLNINSFGAASYIFSPLYGAMTATGKITPATMALFGVYGVQSTVSIMTPATYIMFGLAALTIFTMGPVNTGCTYLIRSVVRGNPIFFFHDFFYAIKKNFRQCMFLGIADCVIYGLLTYNIILSYFNSQSFSFGIVFYANILLFILYSIMRFYIYLLLVTFDLKTFKIYKNALIFAIINGKRNLMAVSGIAVALAIVYTAMYIFMPVGIMIPFAILISTCAFMGCYAAYPKVKEIMIDPYYDSDEVISTSETPIFSKDELN